MNEAADAREMIGRAAALAEAVAPLAGECERLGRLTDRNVALIGDSGLLGCLVPKALGGADLTLSVLADCLIAIAHVCPSTAWVTGLFAFHNGFASRGGPELVARLFGQGMPGIASSLNGIREARIEEVDGHFVLHGTWDYCSGCDRAAWFLLAAKVAEGRHLLSAVPRDQVEIEHDSWQVLGMAGTGSKTVHVRGAIVPKNLTVAIERGVVLTHEDRPAEPPFPMIPIFAACLSAVIVGIAASALDHVVEASRTVPRRDGTRSAENQRNQLRIGEAAALVAIARDALRVCTARNDLAISPGPALNVAQRVGLRNESAAIAGLCLRAVDILAVAAGGGAVRKGALLERCLRDIRTASSHFVISTDVAAEQQGRLMLGLEPNSAY